MRILAIDDKPEELEKATKAIIKSGHKVITIQAGTTLGEWIGDAVEEVDGVITDLNFPTNLSRSSEEPNGLLVVIECILHNKPVVICTDGDHHKECGWIYDSYLMGHQWGPSRFSLVDHKSWDEAVTKVVTLLETRKKTYKRGVAQEICGQTFYVHD